MLDSELFRMFEAARWAPSASNLQPWRFLYARRDTADWPLFFGCLKPGNQGWAADASVLLAVVSKRVAPVKDSDTVRENYSHSFDTGAACMALALQAAAMGWAAHAMGGFDLARAVNRPGRAGGLPRGMHDRRRPPGRGPRAASQAERSRAADELRARRTVRRPGPILNHRCKAWPSWVAVGEPGTHCLLRLAAPRKER